MHLILLSIVFPAALGYYLICFIDRNKPFPFTVRLSLGYGLGLGCITQWMLILSVLRIPLSLLAIMLPLTFLLLFLTTKCLLRYYSSNHESSQHFIFKWNVFSAFLVTYILICLSYIIWRAVNIPISAWDAISYNGFIAKVIYYEKSLQYLPNMPHYEYPLHVPFLHVWASLCLGEWHDIFINIFFSVIPSVLSDFLLLFSSSIYQSNVVTVRTCPYRFFEPANSSCKHCL